MNKRTYLMTPQGSRLGVDHHLPCGGFYIIGTRGNDYCFVLRFAADSYSHLSNIDEYTPSNPMDKEWHEFALDVLKRNYRMVWHSEQSLDEERESLGLAASPVSEKG